MNSHYFIPRETIPKRRLAKELGAKDCLDKPWDLDDLSEVVRKYCGSG